MAWRRRLAAAGPSALNVLWGSPTRTIPYGSSGGIESVYAALGAAGPFAK